MGKYHGDVKAGGLCTESMCVDQVRTRGRERLEIEERLLQLVNGDRCRGGFRGRARGGTGPQLKPDWPLKCPCPQSSFQVT